MARLSRPYALLDQEPSVTQILALVPKPGLPFAAARETAVFAVRHSDWREMHPDDAVNRLAVHHRGVWDGRAAMGTLVHLVQEAYAHGRAVDLEQVVDEVLAEPKARTLRQMQRDDLIEMVLGYVLGLEAWWHDWTPTDVRSEIIVRWPGLFVGTVDMRCQIGGDDWLLDLKTTQRQDPTRGIYPDSWTLQLAFYGLATEEVTFAVTYTDAGRPIVTEEGTRPWSRPERYGVIHLRGDETASFYEVPVTREVQRTALRLARAYPVVKRLGDADLTPQEPIHV